MTKLRFAVSADESYNTVFSLQQERTLETFSRIDIIQFVEDVLKDIKALVATSSNVKKTEEKSMLTMETN